MNVPTVLHPRLQLRLGGGVRQALGGIPRRLRIGLLIAMLATPALYGGWLWARDCALVSVEHVQISGARGPEARRVEAALGEAARRMSTLDVRLGALRTAVAPYPTVRDLRVDAGFPHTLRIRVLDRLPVASLLVGGARTAVAADGVVLGAALLRGSLPLVHGAADDPLGGGGSVRSPGARSALAVLGAAPPTLLGWIERVFEGPKGLTVAMRNGLRIYFGDATRPHAKWLATARVLADHDSAGAWYLDVRLPERPAAGVSGAASTASEAGAASGATQVGATDPTAAALAASLAEAVKGGPAPEALAPAPGG